MTHSGGKSHTNVGDRGQRYEITCFDSSINKRIVLGWSDAYDRAEKMGETMCKRPGWSDAKIRDRQELSQ